MQPKPAHTTRDATRTAPWLACHVAAFHGSRCNTQHATCDVQDASCKMQHTTCKMRRSGKALATAYVGVEHDVDPEDLEARVLVAAVLGQVHVLLRSGALSGLVQLRGEPHSAPKVLYRVAWAPARASMLHVVRCMRHVGSCMVYAVALHVACCPLHGACCMLHAAGCTRHVACCVLHVGC